MDDVWWVQAIWPQGLVTVVTCWRKVKASDALLAARSWAEKWLVASSPPPPRMLVMVQRQQSTDRLTNVDPVSVFHGHSLGGQLFVSEPT